ncbi:MAG: hypothetical protein RBU30_16345 [Polyangia bacterium]|jgi:hypothetical protein|nr:hypothetical protein [Polyangia bacterium]
MTGTGGSMARFALHGEHLYTLGRSELVIFDLRDGLSPEQIGSQRIGWDVETLFLSGNRLFVGARSGMYIYDVSVPQAPRQLAFTGHLYACDPVVVRGDTAFVTLRKGSQCRGGSNELRVYDVSNPTQPELIATYPMKNPWGLGVDGPWLFVADGRAGLKVFDSRDPRRIVEVQRLRRVTGYDVIPSGGLLIISAADGLYQYDYSQGRLRRLSRIPIGGGPGSLRGMPVAIPPPAPGPKAPARTPPASPPVKKQRRGPLEMR